MTGFDTLSSVADNPRAAMVHIDCAACGEAAPVGLPDQAAGLPVHCPACGAAHDDRAVLLANLQLARAEITELGRVVGLALAAFVSVTGDQPHTRHAPQETMERTIDKVAGDSLVPAVAALAAAVMRR